MKITRIKRFQRDLDRITDSTCHVDYKEMICYCLQSMAHNLADIADMMEQRNQTDKENSNDTK